jgi:hypothetical protein
LFILLQAYETLSTPIFSHSWSAHLSISNGIPLHTPGPLYTLGPNIIPHLIGRRDILGHDLHDTSGLFDGHGPKLSHVLIRPIYILLTCLLLGPALYLGHFISLAEPPVTHAGRANYKQAHPEARNKVTPWALNGVGKEAVGVAASP